MSKNNVIHTCHGCPEYYADGTGLKALPVRHCGYDDHWDCSRFRGEDDPLILRRKKNK